MRFSTRLILYVIICVSLSLAAAGGSIYFSTRRIILAEIKNHQWETARQTMREVDRLLNKAFLDIQGLAEDTTVEGIQKPRGRHLAILERDLKEKLDLTGPWDALLIANLNGRIIASTSREWGGRDVRTYGALNAAFESALKGKMYYSDLVREPDTGRPTVIFSAPIRDEDDGMIKGAAMGFFAWPVVLQIFDEIGPESEVHMITRAGLIVGTRTIHQGAILKGTHPEFLAADAGTAAPAGDAWIAAVSHSHDKVMVSKADQEGYLGYRGSGWRLILETDLDYALKPIHRMAGNLILIVLFILGAVTAGMYVLGRRFSRPVESLTRQAALLGGGDLTVRAAIERKDEMGQLAAAFNRMAEELGRITVSRESLRESEERYRVLFVNSRDAFMTAAPPSWLFTSGNKATLRMFEVGDEAAFTKLGPWDVSPEFQPDGRPSSEAALAMMQTAMEKGAHFFEWTHRRLGGALFPSTVLLTRMEIGGQALLQGIVRDISDQKALEDGLRKAYEDLKNVQGQLVQSGKLASIGELAAGVAHELNQPLMVIRGTAQMIERTARKGSLSPDALLSQLEPIDRNTKRMMRIIGHLRTFSRQSEMEFQPVEINRVIEECFLLIGEQLKLRDITVERDFAPDLPKIRADANQLEQVFLNLLGNSRDAVTEAREKAAAEGREAPPGRIAIITRLAARDSLPGQAGAVEVLIRDAGGGIPSDKVSRIFEPFFTTKAVGKGTGLGLSITYGIVKDHGGEIDVTATGPEGTTMRILLPVRE